MSQTIDVAFIKQYESEVHEAYQRRGGLLRGTVRTKVGIQGADTTFQKVGKGIAGGKARHGLVPVMNLEHTNVNCPISDWYAGDWVDNLDELKTNIDERLVIVNAGAWALGRRSDQLIIDALDTATNTTGMVLTNSATFRNSVVQARENLQTRDVPDDGQRFCFNTPRFTSWLMTIDEFKSADYIGSENLPFKMPPGMRARNWLNIWWIEHSGLTGIGATSSSFMLHSTAVGHAIQSEANTDITWHGDRASHFIANSIAQGACLIDNEGVEEMTLVEGTALPTA